jgi:AcrR family transcriptional regulator
VRPNREPSGQSDLTFTEAARRRQIVRCAIETIAELGYERASLAEIAKRAGVSKGVISYHFAGKDELIDQVVADVYTAGSAYMLPLLQQQETAAAALRTYIRANISFIGAHRPDVQAVVEIVSSSRTPDGRPRFDITGTEPAVTDLEHVFRWGQETGEFRAFSTNVMAITLRAAIDALGPRLRSSPELDFDAYAEELVALFERATSNTPTSARKAERGVDR